MDALGNGQYENYHPVGLSKMSLNCLLYAADIILMSESEKGLQRCLDSLKSHCNQWHVKVHLTKTKFMMVSKTDRLSKLKLYSLEMRW